MPRPRRYGFTANNWTQATKDQLKLFEKRCKYIVYGEEHAPTTGTPHLQGFIVLINGMSMKAIHKCVEGLSLFTIDGTDIQNITYTNKEGGNVYTYGELPHQGRRTDLQGLIGRIKDGESTSSIIPDLSNFQQIRTAELLLKYYEPKRHYKPEVQVFWGSTGTGKTRKAWELMPECYNTTGTKWFDGYDGEHDVLIDEFRPDEFFTYQYMLKLLDRYPFRVEYKGGFRQFQAKRIIITAPNHPKDWYPAAINDSAELLRRIDKITHFDKIC